MLETVVTFLLLHWILNIVELSLGFWIGTKLYGNGKEK